MTDNNAKLEHVLHLAGYTPGRLAEALEVDEKTVLRWLAGATRPYRRHRYAAAQLLGVDPRELWPDPVQPDAPPASDLVTVYDSRLDVPDAVWLDLTATPGPVDILDNNLTWLADNHPLLVAELACHSLQGLAVRVALQDPDLVDTSSDSDQLYAAALARRSLADLDPLLDADRAIRTQIRLHRGVHVSIYRFGDQMLVQPHLPALTETLAPVWHLRHATDAGPFDRHLAALTRVWQAATPLPKHKRDVPGDGPTLIPPELAGEEGPRADASRARARANIRRIVLNLRDDTQSVHYSLGPELDELLIPAADADSRARAARRAARHPQTQRR